MHNHKIIELDVSLPSSLAGRGYKIFYWQVKEGIYDAPIEPLTQEYWKESKNSSLIYGTFIPATRVNQGADLAILVTQSLGSTKQIKFGGLSARQRRDLYKLIMEINFLQADELEAMPFFLQQTFFKKFEKLFAEQVMPQKDRDGNYYRPPSSEQYEFPTLDHAGRFKCANCNQIIAIGHGFTTIQSFPVEDGTLLMFGECQKCKKILALVKDPQTKNEK
jgi:hypothetical protein